MPEQRHYLGGPLSPRGVRNAWLEAYTGDDPNEAERGLADWYAELTAAAKQKHEIVWFSATGYAYTLTRTDTARVQKLLERLIEGLRRT